QLLTWGGIIGGCITVFTNLSTMLTLADWARVLVERWHEITTAFWVAIFGWLGIHIPKDMASLLTFVAFTVMLVVGTNLSSRREDSNANRYHVISGQSRKFALSVGIGLYLLVILIVFIIHFGIGYDIFDMSSERYNLIVSWLSAIFWIAP